MRHLAAILSLIGLAVLVNAAVVGDLRPPPHWDPWAPLDVSAPATPVTGWKLARLERSPTACRAALESSRLDWQAVDDRPSDVGCGLSDAVRLTGGSPRLGEPALASCPLAVALAMWAHHGITPAAAEHLGSPVARLEHWGTHVCRDIAGTNRRSEHATANAIDIAAFVLEDGRRVVVHRDWSGAGPEGRFLRAVRDAACEAFDVVLGPNYNAAHDDHLHLDMGRFSACR
ncbi:extensin family protein [Caenispirillum salinarum]|uniref:extensin-like domain-containing protein n=1 Tax=Caenispirillum salinarum TaxID=859058 RepID=UPI00384F5C8D